MYNIIKRTLSSIPQGGRAAQRTVCAHAGINAMDAGGLRKGGSILQFVNLVPALNSKGEHDAVRNSL